MDQIGEKTECKKISQKHIPIFKAETQDHQKEYLKEIQKISIESTKMFLNLIQSKIKYESSRRLLFTYQKDQRIIICLQAHITSLLNDRLFRHLEIQMQNKAKLPLLVRKAQQNIYPKEFKLQANWINQKEVNILKLSIEEYDPKYLYYFIDPQDAKGHSIQSFAFLKRPNSYQIQDKPLKGLMTFKKQQEFYSFICKQFSKNKKIRIKGQDYNECLLNEMIPIQFHSNIKQQKKQSQGYPRHKNQSLLVFKYRNKHQIIQAITKVLKNQNLSNYSIEYPYQSQQTHLKRSIIFVSHQISAQTLKKYIEIHLIHIFKFTVLVTLTKYLRINASTIRSVLPFFQKFKVKYGWFPQGFAIKVGQVSSSDTYDIYMRFQMFQESTYSFVVLDNLRINVWAVKERDYNNTSQDKKGMFFKIIPLIEKELDLNKKLLYSS